MRVLVPQVGGGRIVDLKGWRLAWSGLLLFQLAPGQEVFHTPQALSKASQAGLHVCRFHQIGRDQGYKYLSVDQWPAWVGYHTGREPFSAPSWGFFSTGAQDWLQTEYVHVAGLGAPC